MNRRIKYLVIFGLWLLSCVGMYIFGTIAGFSKGTATSTVLAAAGRANNSAIEISLALGTIREKSPEHAINVLERFLKSDINNYYRYKDTFINEKYFLNRFNYFEPIALAPMKYPAEYVRKYINADEIKANEGYQQLLNEYPESN